MSDRKDRKNDEAKYSKPRHESNEIIDRSKSGAGKDAGKISAKGNIEGDAQRTSKEAKKDAGNNPQSRKQEERTD